MTLTEAAEWAAIIGTGVAILGLLGWQITKPLRSSRQDQRVGDGSTVIQSGRDSNVEINNDKAKPGSRKR